MLYIRMLCEVTQRIHVVGRIYGRRSWDRDGGAHLLVMGVSGEWAGGMFVIQQFIASAR